MFVSRFSRLFHVQMLSRAFRREMFLKTDKNRKKKFHENQWKSQYGATTKIKLGNSDSTLVTNCKHVMGANYVP